MAIDHKLITPCMDIEVPMLSCDVLGSGEGRYALRVNQDTLITSQPLDYVLAYRKELFTNRKISVPEDFEREWRKDRAPLWSLADYGDETNTEVLAWWKFDELNRTLNDGDSITTVSDSGPNGLTLTAANGIAFDSDGLNDRGMAIMTADDDRFTTPDSASLDWDTDLLEMYIVWKPSLTGASHTTYRFYDKRDTSTASKLEWFHNIVSGRGGTNYEMRLRRGTLKIGNNFQLTDGTGYIHSVVQEDLDGSVNFHRNGIADGTPTGGVTSDIDNDGVLAIGNHATNDQSISGSIGEFIIIKHTATGASIREKIEGYLANKWGIDLPSGHTYETDPPRRSSVYTG
jgi:hypothetical protein